MYEEAIVIYADILFLINLSLDYLCLFLSARLLHRHSTALRMVGGAVIGALYSFVPYIFAMPSLVSLLLSLVTACVICLVAFGYESARALTLSALTFVVSGALLGGIIIAIYSLVGGYHDGVYTEASLTSFCIISTLSAVIALCYGLICRKRLDVRSAEVEIELCNGTARLSLLCDSGNLVTEPFSALPVIVVSSTSLPPPYDTPESEHFPHPIRAIPFSTSSGRGCFIGFKPKKAELILPLCKPKRIEAYIGIDTERKSYSGYDGLIPTSLL